MRLATAALAAAMLLSGWGSAQEQDSPPTVPMVVLQNEHLRITRLAEVNNSGTVRSDTVIVPLPSTEADSPKPPEPSFTARGGKFAATEGFDILLVELAKHRDVPMRTCQEPAACVRKIMVGEAEVGERKQLFTSGFVTGSLQVLKKGGSLTSSYYSAKGVDHVLIVAFTDTTFLLDGVEQPLQSGQVFFTEAKEVEVNTGHESEARWFTLRLNEPR